MNETSLSDFKFSELLNHIGVRKILDFITPQEEKFLIEQIDACPAKDARTNKPQFFERTRVLRFGEDHKGLVQEFIPPWLGNFVLRPPLRLWTRAGVNYYAPGAGLEAHIDDASYGDTVSILSLGGFATLLLHRPYQPLDEFFIEVPMEPRSLVQLTGPSRYEWSHSVPPVKQPRYSIVFRN